MPTTPYLITDKRTGKTFNRDLDDEQIGAIPENFSATPSAFAAQDPSFADDRPDAQPEPTPEPIAQPEYEPPIGVTDFAEFEQVEPDDRNIFARSWDALKGGAGEAADWIQGDVEKGFGQNVPPEVRGIARGTTGNNAPAWGSYAQGKIASGLESAFPVDDEGVPRREYESGRSTDPNRDPGKSLGLVTEEAERAEYDRVNRDEPFRSGVGEAYGSTPYYLAAGMAAAPEAALTRAQNFAKAAGAFSGTETALAASEGPETALKRGAFAAAIPPAFEGAGTWLAKQEPKLAHLASRSRLAAATGTMPFGAPAKKLVRDKGAEKLTRMGEVVEEQMTKGRGPMYKTDYEEQIEPMLRESGKEIGAIQQTMGESGARVDIGPLIASLTREGKKEIGLGMAAATTRGRRLLEMADEFKALTETGVGRRITPGMAEKRAEAIRRNAVTEQNTVIEGGREMGMADDEIIQMTDQIAASAERRAEAVLRRVDTPYEVNYQKAHDLRSRYDKEAWNNRTGDASASEWAADAREVAGDLRSAISETIEMEAPQFAGPLRSANERYEAAAWLKHNANVGSSSRTSQLTAMGAGGLASGLGVGMASGPSAGITTGLGTMAAAEGVRRYGPGVTATTQRALSRGAGGFSRNAGPLGVGTAAAVGSATNLSPRASMIGDGGDGDVSGEVERVLKMAENDPEAFGELTNAVVEAAQEAEQTGDPTRMRMIIVASRRQGEN